MNLLKYKSENDFSKDGWRILTFSTFKVHVNIHRNKNELYSSYRISDDDKIELDTLFDANFKFIIPLLLDIGIDFYVLAEKKIEKCFFTKAEIRPFVYNILMFKFYGNLSVKSKETQIKPKVELSETYNNNIYKITFDNVESDREKLLLKIEFKE